MIKRIPPRSSRALGLSTTPSASKGFDELDRFIENTIEKGSAAQIRAEYVRLINQRVFSDRDRAYYAAVALSCLIRRNLAVKDWYFEEQIMANSSASQDEQNVALVSIARTAGEEEVLPDSLSHAVCQRVRQANNLTLEMVESTQKNVYFSLLYFSALKCSSFSWREVLSLGMKILDKSNLEQSRGTEAVSLAQELLFRTRQYENTSGKKLPPDMKEKIRAYAKMVLDNIVQFEPAVLATIAIDLMHHGFLDFLEVMAGNPAFAELRWLPAINCIAKQKNEVMELIRSADLPQAKQKLLEMFSFDWQSLGKNLASTEEVNKLVENHFDLIRAELLHLWFDAFGIRMDDYPLPMAGNPKEKILVCCCGEEKELSTMLDRAIAALMVLFVESWKRQTGKAIDFGNSCFSIPVETQLDLVSANDVFVCRSIGRDYLLLCFYDEKDGVSLVFPMTIRGGKLIPPVISKNKPVAFKYFILFALYTICSAKGEEPRARTVFEPVESAINKKARQTARLAACAAFSRLVAHWSEELTPHWENMIEKQYMPARAAVDRIEWEKLPERIEYVLSEADYLFSYVARIRLVPNGRHLFAIELALRADELEEHPINFLIDGKKESIACVEAGMEIDKDHLWIFCQFVLGLAYERVARYLADKILETVSSAYLITEGDHPLQVIENVEGESLVELLGRVSAQALENKVRNGGLFLLPLYVRDDQGHMVLIPEDEVRSRYAELGSDSIYVQTREGMVARLPLRRKRGEPSGIGAYQPRTTAQAEMKKAGDGRTLPKLGGLYVVTTFSTGQRVVQLMLLRETEDAFYSCADLKEKCLIDSYSERIDLAEFSSPDSLLRGLRGTGKRAVSQLLLEAATFSQEVDVREVCFTYRTGTYATVRQTCNRFGVSLPA